MTQSPGLSAAALLRNRRFQAVVGVAWALAFLAGAFLAAKSLRATLPVAGRGVVVGKEDGRRGATVLRLRDGGSLEVVAVGGRIDAGDEVVKRAGELSCLVNGRRVSPLPTVVGRLLLTYLFMPAIALFPAVILFGTREG